MSLYLAQPPAEVLAQVLDSQQSDVACTGIGSANATSVKSFYFSNIHSQYAVYRLFVTAVIPNTGGITGANLLLKVKSGVTVTQTYDFDLYTFYGTAASTRRTAIIDIIPTSSSSLAMIITLPAQTAAGNDNTLNSDQTLSTAWSAQTEIELLGYVTTGGTMTVKAATMTVMSV